jgi:hypothetical protein
MESGMKWDSGRWRATVPFRAARERGWARAAAGLLAAAASTAVFTAACAGPAGPAGPSHPPGMAGGLWQAQWWWPAGLSQP